LAFWAGAAAGQGPTVVPRGGHRRRSAIALGFWLRPGCGFLLARLFGGLLIGVQLIGAQSVRRFGAPALQGQDLFSQTLSG